jgi:hypothetical protein
MFGFADLIILVGVLWQQRDPSADMLAVDGLAAAVEDEVRSYGDQYTISRFEDFPGYIPVENVVGEFCVRQEKLAFLVVDAAGAATAAFYDPNVHNATADCGGQDWPRETNFKTPRIIRVLIVIGSQDLLGFLLRIRMTVPPADTGDFCGDVTGEVSPDFVMDLPFVDGVAGAEVTNLRQKQAFLVAALATRFAAFITGGFIDRYRDSHPIEDLAVCTIGCRTAGVR